MKSAIKRKERMEGFFTNIKKLSKYVHGYWKDTIITWVCVVLETACEVLSTYLMQFMVNSIETMNMEVITDEVKQQAFNDVCMYGGLIAGLVIVAVITGILAGVFASSAAAGFGKNLREAEFVHVQDYSFKNIDKFSTSSIVTRTTTDVTNVQFAFMQIIRTVIRAPLLMIFALTMAFVTDWKVAWIFLAIIPVVLTVLIVVAKGAHPLFVNVFNTYDELNESVQEDVDGIRVVKSFNREKQQSDKFHGVSDYIYKNFVKAEKLLAFNSPTMNLAIYGATIFIAYVGSVIIVQSAGSSNPELQTGSLSTLITYIMMISNAMMMISMVYVMLTMGKTSAERIIECIEEVPDIKSPENPITEVKDGQVDFDHVNFGYVPEKYVLHDVDLHVKSGSMIGIIGSTGSSKTTLISLIARLYDVNEGEVKVGGINVKDYDLVTLRDSVAVVLQKNTLFTGTIRDNLKWGNENATDEQIMHVCDIAQVTPFLSALPNGLDTMLSEGGTNVSGGQKQRLCIARALLKNPKILILDDSTSACDTHTDALIRESLQKGRSDITKFIIAQRILSVKDCDEIWVMDNGYIIAKGNNDYLLKNCSVYKELYESQLSGGDFDAAE